jgi:hypothetical protein
MKGPFERLKYDLRRIWECPQCGHKVRTDGSATTQFCRCGKSNTSPTVVMKLVGDGPRRLVPIVPPPSLEVAASPQVEVAVVTQVEVVAVAAEKVVEVTTTEVESPTEDAAGPEA